MNCPKCDRYTPDDSLKCANCGHIFEASPPSAGAYKKGSPKGGFSGKNKFWLIFPVLGAAVLLYLVFFPANSSNAEKNSQSGVLNAQTAGEELDVEEFIQPGKMNIVDFYSDFCPPCRRISPLLEKLDQKRDDIVVIKLDINRKGVRGIDWKSPLARQYNIRTIPNFMIYDSNGDLVAEGKAAYRQVANILNREGIQ